MKQFKKLQDQIAKSGLCPLGLITVPKAKKTKKLPFVATLSAKKIKYVKI